MDEGFDIPVLYNNQRMNFPAQLLAYGYSYKIEVDIEGTKVFFEPDEERNWRASLGYEDTEGNKKINKELLKAIADSIEEIVK
ncbi:MAG: hypothetical protein ABIR18_03620 [Chitinophagaceae bacterium]